MSYNRYKKPRNYKEALELSKALNATQRNENYIKELNGTDKLNKYNTGKKADE